MDPRIKALTDMLVSTLLEILPPPGAPPPSVLLPQVSTLLEILQVAKWEQIIAEAANTKTLHSPEAWAAYLRFNPS
jgi:hypothetical protein